MLRSKNRNPSLEIDTQILKPQYQNPNREASQPKSEHSNHKKNSKTLSAKISEGVKKINPNSVRRSENRTEATGENGSPEIGGNL